MPILDSMELFDILRRGAAASPDNTAVTHGDRSISYREIVEASDKVTGKLKQLDVEPGSRAAILYDNSIEYIMLFFAVTQAGFVVVPLDTSLKPAKLSFILNDCGAKVLLVQDKYTRIVKELIDNTSPVELVIAERKPDLTQKGIEKASLADILDRTDTINVFEKVITGIGHVTPSENLTHKTPLNCPDNLAAIFYTSGSTGTPKGVMLSHRNLVSNTVATVEYLGLRSEDSVIVILPFHYIYGNSLLLTHVLVGGRLVIDNRFAFPQVILQTMIKERVTGFSGVPSNFMILLNNANFTSEYLKDLRYLTQAGGALAPEVIRKLINAFSDKDIYIMYGQTEASPRVSYLPPDVLHRKVGSAGIAVPGVTITVTDENGSEVPPGKIGEIVVSGDNVMLGYWNQPEEQDEVLRDGRLYTGDLARCDEEGFLYVVSRKKEILKVGGNRVSVREIEEKILESEKVLEAAVIGIRDDILGEAIKAFIVLREELSANVREIQDYCRTDLAPHKVPKFIEFVPSLPKYPSGKINKQALANMSH
ncbi:MAG: class I adenylate-forming enzyme family protein [candidate division Zixibacteria bacterium]|nr:class I adenylate-forming enzyme family protein [candidate division Zixibacteria bacterium]